jgi:DNA-3-methyladenine glycosylase II
LFGERANHAPRLKLINPREESLVYFEYGDKETEYPKRKDKRFTEAMDKIDHIRRALESVLFLSVIRSIVGHQISFAAQRIVQARQTDKLGAVSMETISAASREERWGPRRHAEENGLH